MAVPTDRNRQFFLTRQSANVLEDLSRQIVRPGSICLLLGQVGVGKSRLLQEFIRARVLDGQVKLLRFLPEGGCVETIGDKVAATGSSFTLNTLNELGEGVLLVLDDFHHASSTVKQQLLAYWDSDAAANRQNLIIAGEKHLITDLRNLPIQISTAIDSVELLPLNMDERVEYLSARLCDQAWQRIVAGREVKKALHACGGFFPALDRLVQQYRGQLECRERATGRPPVMRMAAVALVLTLIVLGGLFVVQDGGIDGNTVLQPSLSKALVEPGPAPAGLNNAPAEIPSLSVASAAPAQNDENPSHEPVALNDRDDAPASPAQSEPPPAVTVEALDSREPAPQSARLPAEPAQETLSLLQQRLSTTEKWIQSSAGAAASIQIMTLTRNAAADPQEAMSAYLRKLEGQGIDVEDIYIYQVRREDVTRFGVLYGEYPDRNAALGAIQDLPRVLRSNGPIPRTVRGLRQEIARWQGSS